MTANPSLSLSDFRHLWPGSDIFAFFLPPRITSRDAKPAQYLPSSPDPRPSERRCWLEPGRQRRQAGVAVARRGSPWLLKHTLAIRTDATDVSKPSAYVAGGILLSYDTERPRAAYKMECCNIWKECMLAPYLKCIQVHIDIRNLKSTKCSISF